MKLYSSYWDSRWLLSSLRCDPSDTTAHRRLPTAHLATTLLLLIASSANAQCIDGQCPLPPSSPPYFGSQVDTSPYAAVSCRVQHQTQRGTQWGSGTVVRSDGNRCWVLTCHHLFRGRVEQVRCLFADGESRAASVVVTDVAHDLALLEVDGDTPVARVAKTTTAGPVTAFGFGVTGKLRATRGALLGKAQTTGAEFPSLRIAATVMAGDSGGGVFNERSELCGVVWGVRGGVAYATPLEPIRRLLARVHSNDSPKHEDPIVESPKYAPAPNVDRHAAWRAGVDKRLEQLAGRIDNLRTLIPNPLDTPPPVDPLPGIQRRLEPRLDTWRAEILGQVHSAVHDLVRERLSALPAAATWSITQIAVGGVSLASPIGIGLLAGAWLLRRRRRGAGGPRDDGFRRATARANE